MKTIKYLAGGLISTIVPGAIYIGYLSYYEWNNPYYWSGQFPAYIVVALMMGLAIGIVGLSIRARIWQVFLCGSVGWIASLPFSIGILRLVWFLPGWLCPQSCMDTPIQSSMEKYVVVLQAGIWIVVGCVIGTTLLMLMRRITKLRTLTI